MSVDSLLNKYDLSSQGCAVPPRLESAFGADDHTTDMPVYGKLRSTKDVGRVRHSSSMAK